MVDVSGIPNMGFGGGAYFAGNPNYAAQNNANLNYVNNASQASYNPATLYGGGGFGSLTDYYSGMGAAYGRATGYYGDPYSSTPVSPAASYGIYGGDTFGGNQAATFDQRWSDPYTGGMLSPYNWSTNQSAFDPNTYAPTPSGGSATMEPYSGSPGGLYYGGGGSPFGQGGVDPYFGTTGGGSPPVMAWGQEQPWLSGAAQQYLQANPDVASAASSSGMDPLQYAEQHFQNYGQNEGRQGFGLVGSPSQTATGPAAAYFAANPDVAAAAAASGMDPNLYAEKHYVNYGFDEGRAGMGLTANPEQQYLSDNPYLKTATQQYFAANPDVAAAAGSSGMNPELFAEQHYLDYGQNEGRGGYGLGISPEDQYLIANPDVLRAAQAAGGNQEQFANLHYVQYGQNEGRNSFGMADFVSPSNDYNTFQQGATPTPWWQKGGGNNPDVLSGVKSTAGSLGIDPAALGALFQEESNWNPRSNMYGNWGLGQMSSGQFKDAGGTLGGLTFQQYQQASPADQIYSYNDMAARALARNPGLVLGQYDVPIQYSVLQALNFNPVATANAPWMAGLLRGDTTIPILTGATAAAQARDLRDANGNVTLNSIAAAYNQKAR
jgi:hypothetical protein